MLSDSSTNASRGEGKGPKKRLPAENFLEDLGSRDIMAQSMMRQTLRGYKQNVFDTNLNNEQNMFKIGSKTPGEFTVFRSSSTVYPPERKNSEDRLLGGFGGDAPSTHDDVQILNLQGFMDSDLRGQTALPSRGEHKHKSRRRQVRGLDDSSPSDKSQKGSKYRHKKKSKQKGSTSSQTEDVILKDIDDIDEKMASLVVGPKQSFKDSSGRPITFEEAIRLRQILTGGPNTKLPKEWMDQSFIQNKNSNLSYGIVQKKVSTLK